MGDRIIPQIGDYTKIEVVSFVAMKLKSNLNWAKRGCVAIYEQQTPREQKTHISRGRNQCGFCRNDAPLLTSLAGKIKQNRLPIEDHEVLLKKMPRYARQLICLSYEKDEGKNLLKHLDMYYKDQKTKIPF
jgi:hypothetical protein